jgi:hypothetical protein
MIMEKTKGKNHEEVAGSGFFFLEKSKSAGAHGEKKAVLGSVEQTTKKGVSVCGIKAPRRVSHDWCR